MDSMPPEIDLKEKPEEKLRAARPKLHPLRPGEGPQMPAGFTRYTPPRSGYLAQLAPPKAPRAVTRAVKPGRTALATFLERLSTTPRRRARTSFALAFALNFVVFALLGLYGAVTIWIPATPGTTQVVMIDATPLAAPFPDLRDELATPVKPDIKEPEVVEKPKIEPAPEPKPAPDEKAEKPPEPDLSLEPLPARERPPLKLDLEPKFARPEDVAPSIPEPDIPAPVAEPDLSVAPKPADRGAQTPAETPEPLVEPGAQKAEDAAAEALKQADAKRLADEEAARKAAELKAETDAAAKAPALAPQGDDAFDEAPTLGPKAAVPKIELPPGASPGAPGSSGVVAIYCPKQFKTNKDKAEECAGRTEIRSGWRPGKSGEDWSKAVELLKKERAAGKFGDDQTVKFTTPGLRKLEGDLKARDAAPAIIPHGPSPSPIAGGTIATPGGDSLNGSFSGAGAVGGGVGPPSVRTDHGPVSQKEIRKLEKALDDAEKAKSGGGDDAPKKK